MHLENIKDIIREEIKDKKFIEDIEDINFLQECYHVKTIYNEYNGEETFYYLYNGIYFSFSIHNNSWNDIKEYKPQELLDIIQEEFPIRTEPIFKSECRKEDSWN